MPVLLFCLVLCLLLATVLRIGSEPRAYYPLLGYAFFIEPYFSVLSGTYDFVPAVVFGIWLLTAGALAKMRRENRQFRPVLLLLLPPMSICAFNALFNTGVMLLVAPTAIMAVIGVIIYEVAYAEGWVRIATSAVTAALCLAYGMHTGLGAWGSIVASFMIALVQLVWSAAEMRVFNLTSHFCNRKFQYR